MRLLANLLSMVLLWAAISKIFFPAHLESALDGFVPTMLHKFARYALIIFESLAGLLLFSPRLRSEVATLILLFIGLATMFVAARLASGRPFACGCLTATGRGVRTAENRGVRDAQRLVQGWPGLYQDALQPVLFSARNASILSVAMLLSQSARQVSPLAIVASFCGVSAVVGLALLFDLSARRRLIAQRLHPLRDVYIAKARPLVAMSWYGHGLYIEGGRWNFERKSSPSLVEGSEDAQGCMA